MFAIGAGGFLWQPYLKSFNIPLEWFGIVTSIGAFIAIGVPILTHKFAKKFTKTSRYILLLIAVFMSTFLLASIVKTPIFAGALIILIYVSIMFVMPVEQPFFQKFLPDKMRATLGSFKGMADGFAIGISTIVMGIIADLFGVRIALASAAIFLIPALIIYFKIGKHGH